MVDVGGRCRVEASSVGRATKGFPLILIVLIGNFDINLDLSVNSVLDVVLSIVSIYDLSLDFFWLLLSSLNGDLEGITA